MAEPTLILYSTGACHLCEQAENLLAQLVWPVPLVVEVVDISESDALMQRYGPRIPVLAVYREGDAAGLASTELDWPFGVDAVVQALQAAPGP